jgi:hypothetical protein
VEGNESRLIWLLAARTEKTKTFCQDGRYPGQDLNPVRIEYVAKVSLTIEHASFCLLYYRISGRGTRQVRNSIHYPLPVHRNLTLALLSKVPVHLIQWTPCLANSATFCSVPCRQRSWDWPISSFRESCQVLNVFRKVRYVKGKEKRN